MCDRCETLEAATAAELNLDTEEVRRVVETYVKFADAFASDDSEPSPEEKDAEELVWRESGFVSREILDALIVQCGGPVVVVAARGAMDGSGVVVTTTCAGLGERDLATKMLREALRGIESPLAETGGVMEDGSFVAPMRVRRVL